MKGLSIAIVLSSVALLSATAGSIRPQRALTPIHQLDTPHLPSSSMLRVQFRGDQAEEESLPLPFTTPVPPICGTSRTTDFGSGGGPELTFRELRSWYLDNEFLVAGAAGPAGSEVLVWGQADSTALVLEIISGAVRPVSVNAMVAGGAWTSAGWELLDIYGRVHSSAGSSSALHGDQRATPEYTVATRSDSLWYAVARDGRGLRVDRQDGAVFRLPPAFLSTYGIVDTNLAVYAASIPGGVVVISRVPPYNYFILQDTSDAFVRSGNLKQLSNALTIPENRQPLMLSLNVTPVPSAAEFLLSFGEPSSDLRMAALTDTNFDLIRVARLPAVMTFLSSGTGRRVTALRTVRQPIITVYSLGTVETHP